MSIDKLGVESNYEEEFLWNDPCDSNPLYDTSERGV